jgi:hypothetical protein
MAEHLPVPVMVERRVSDDGCLRCGALKHPKEDVPDDPALVVGGAVDAWVVALLKQSGMSRLPTAVDHFVDAVPADPECSEIVSDLRREGALARCRISGDQNEVPMVCIAHAAHSAHFH